MSFNDIKDGYTNCVISGISYKITYDFNAIAKLEELYSDSFFNLGVIIDNLRNKPLKEILDFCYIGFLRYQPDFKIEQLYDYGSFVELYDKCTTEFLRCVSMPDAYNELIEQGKKTEIKKKKGLKLPFIGTLH